MPKFIVGARLHDYGKGSPDELFGRVAADGFAAVQLAYKKCVPFVRSYADVTDALVAETVAAEKAHSIQVAVLGTYVELAINDESRLKNAADFKSQLAVCKALGAGCIGTETTSMEKQPAGTTREEAQELLCRSLADILPAAEELGVTVAVEPVTYHSMNSAAATRHILETMRSPNLKVIFDMSNLVDAGNVGAQDRIWNDVGELLGDQIVAVHFKGQAFAPDGGLLHTSLEDSLTDYAGAFAMLRQLPQDALPVLREEAVPARAASDIAFMRGFFA
ncbi:sugar phosphate isomerase/epimerase family protein [Gemmiger formicilis]|uniref:sugar phosphate isomerase/epimerase family protein n=1 Tax=Gemmiger formicilis TaxID=745368 RepID=UPI003993FDC3